MSLHWLSEARVQAIVEERARALAVKAVRDLCEPGFFLDGKVRELAREEIRAQREDDVVPRDSIRDAALEEAAAWIDAQSYKVVGQAAGIRSLKTGAGVAPQVDHEHEAWSQKNRADVLSETNDNLRAALECFGVHINHDVVENAKRLAKHIGETKRERDSALAQLAAANEALDEIAAMYKFSETSKSWYWTSGSVADEVMVLKRTGRLK